MVELADTDVVGASFSLFGTAGGLVVNGAVTAVSGLRTGFIIGYIP